VGVVARQAHLCFAELVSIVADDFDEAILAYRRVLLRHNLNHVPPSPRCSVDAVCRGWGMENGKNGLAIALQFVFSLSFPSVLAKSIDAFVLVMPNTIDVMRTNSQEMPNG
jgi:hypothetical protein